MWPSVYWPPTVFQVVAERWQSSLELVVAIVFVALVDVWQREKRLGRLTDNRRDLVLTCLAYCTACVGVYVLWFDTLIWDDTLRQHKDVALEACTVGFQAVYQAYLDAWQVDINLGILAVMLLALAALFTILRGVVAKLWPQK